jgi:hypothetical protein
MDPKDPVLNACGGFEFLWQFTTMENATCMSLYLNINDFLYNLNRKVKPIRIYTK